MPAAPHDGDPATGDAGGELAHLLSELVAFPTESKSPNAALIRWVADHVESNGGRVTVLEGEEGRANLLASFGPQRAGGVMLSGHTDVVPAGPGWASDPYSMTKIGDSLYGRGTADMKGFIAATVRSITLFRGTELTRPLHLALSFDEEIGCIGVRDALRVIVQRDIRPDIVIIGEPTMMRPRHSHMGKLAYEIVCHAAAAHSSLSHSSPSAIASAARLVNVIDALQRRYRPTAEPEVTFNCGTITGGTALNVIAQRCAFTFESRHTVDHDPDVVLRQFMAAVDVEREALAMVGGSVEVAEVTRYPAMRTSSDDAWLHAVERIADAGPATSIGFGTEGGLFAEALDATVVICGPGDIAVAHRPDEYVTVDQLLRCERFLCGVVQQMCVDPVAEK